VLTRKVTAGSIVKSARLRALSFLHCWQHEDHNESSDDAEHADLGDFPHTAIVVFSQTRILQAERRSQSPARYQHLVSRSQILDVEAFEPAFRRPGTDLRGTSLARLNRTSFFTTDT